MDTKTEPRNPHHKRVHIPVTCVHESPGTRAKTTLTAKHQCMTLPLLGLRGHDPTAADSPRTPKQGSCERSRP